MSTSISTNQRRRRCGTLSWTPSGGSRYAVTPAAYNHQIAPGDAAGVGFCANKAGPDYTPEVLAASSP